MAVTGVDKSRGRPLAECVHVVEIGRTVDDTHIDRRHEWPATRAGGSGCAGTKSRLMRRIRVRWHGSPMGLDTGDGWSHTRSSRKSVGRPREARQVKAALRPCGVGETHQYFSMPCRVSPTRQATLRCARPARIPRTKNRYRPRPLQALTRSVSEAVKPFPR